jgi:hypothetical protein
MVRLNLSTYAIEFLDIDLSNNIKSILLSSNNFLNFELLNSDPLSDSINLIFSFSSLINYLKLIIIVSAVLFFNG